MIFKNYISTTILLLLLSLGYSQNKQHYVIASGSQGGNYSKAGKFIAEKYNDNLDARFTSIKTNGSLENIELLKDNFADFAIVQRNILLNSLYDEQKGINNIEVIAPLFEEKLLIYNHSSKPISISEFKNKIIANKCKIGFTSEEGYSFKLFQLVSKYIELDNSNCIFQFSNYDELISGFESNKIDFIISFSLPIKKLDTNKNVDLVYFDKETISLISNRLPNLFNTNLSNDKKHHTIGSWTFLIGLKNKIDQLSSNKNLILSLSEQKLSNNYFGNLISSSISEFKSNKLKTNKYLDGIPSLPALEKEMGINPSFFGRNYLKILLILLLISLYHILTYKKILPKIHYLYLWIRFKHIIIGVLVLGLLYFFSVEFLRISEEKLYDELGIKSQLLNLSNNELNFWILIRNLTGNDNGIFPASVNGKLMLSFTSYIVWIGSLLIALSEFIAYQLSKKRKKGLMNSKYNNHIVVLGWNDSTPQFIVDTIKSAKEFNGKSENIVCVTSNSSEEILESNIELKKLNELKQIQFISGDARDKKTLEKANIHNAKTAILLAEDKTIESDERTLLRALAISKFCRSKALLKEGVEISQSIKYELHQTGKYIDSIYIIAEVNQTDFKTDLLESDVNEVVITSSYGKSIITQSMLNRGVSKVLDEVLQFNEYNEFYIVDLSKSENSHLQNKTFDELLLPLRKQKILLIAIKIVYHDENNKIIIDREIIEKKLEKEGLKREVIINPISDIETNRKADEDDHLIVFATDRKSLEKQIKKVSFNE